MPPVSRAFGAYGTEGMEKVPMTPGGFAALEAELKDRQQVQRQRIITAIAEAREFLAERPYVSAQDARQTVTTHRRW